MHNNSVREITEIFFMTTLFCNKRVKLMQLAGKYAAINFTNLPFDKRSCSQFNFTSVQSNDKNNNNNRFMALCPRLLGEPVPEVTFTYSYLF